MIPRSLACSVLWLTASIAPAQFFAGIDTETRRVARATWRGVSGYQSITFEYGQPKWRAEYGALIDELPANPVLLGNGTLATLRTDVELAFGAQKLARGRWYVAAQRNDRGEWSLVLFAADRVDAGGRGATTLLSGQPDVRIPAQLTRDGDVVQLFDATLSDTKKTPRDLALTMAWGPYRLRVDFAAAFDERQPQGAPAFALTAAGKGTKTASGLVYEVLKEGAGEVPQANDTMTVHYAGWLSDGTMFDSSWVRGEPVPLRMEWVLPGFAEGLQLMRPGATFRLTIPPDLAYGDRGAGRVPPDATLVFVVTLLGVEHR